MPADRYHYRGNVTMRSAKMVAGRSKPLIRPSGTFSRGEKEEGVRPLGRGVPSGRDVSRDTDVSMSHGVKRVAIRIEDINERKKSRTDLKRDHDRFRITVNDNRRG